jgi:uncharacterized protein YbcC (UPF0753/DUF2309 family)
LSHAAHYLPAQAPLEVFVHHNTLHAFQSLPFFEALEVAGRRLRARMLLPERSYRNALHTGRVSDADLRAVLQTSSVVARSEDWPQRLPAPESLAHLIMRHGLHETTVAGLGWLLSETPALQRLREDVPEAARKRLLSVQNADSVSTSPQSEAAMVGALWAACQELSLGAPLPVETPPGLLFFREPLSFLSGEDPSELVHQTLIPLAAAFLDRGIAQWTMPDRMRGFYLVWEDIMTAGLVVRPAWSRQLGRRIRAHRSEGYDAEHEVLSLLDELGITDEEIDEYVTQTLLHLAGWAGMFARLEQNTDPILSQRAKVRLIDFLAVRLELDSMAFLDLARRLGYRGPLRELRTWLQGQVAREHEKPDPLQLAWSLFQLAQLAGLRPQDLRALGRWEVRQLVLWMQRFSLPVRLPIWQQAFERHYRDEILLGLGAIRAARLATPSDDATTSVRPELQVVCCIDDREESLRRHLEVALPQIETFGTAGFFNLAIAYQGIDDPSTFPLCPVVVTPRHKVVEEPDEAHVATYATRQRRQARWSAINETYSRASRSLIGGSLVTALSGFWAMVPLLLTVFAPKLAARLRRRVSQQLLPEVRTHLAVPEEVVSGSAEPGLQTGFVVAEKADRVGTLLENIGLVRRFAKIVIILGHDSHSMNNPHFAAYACGACGGRSGGPNARLFARMANRPKVRELLRTRGIDIPDDTRFVGGVHDTCDDSIKLFDEDQIPESLWAELNRLKEMLRRALMDNARERARRFDAAPLGVSPAMALDHVDERSADLSQARPELGHATNASAIIGRRALTKGLFLDRRAFLVSYDPTIDPTGAILERTLAAVTPVGAGINLEYFFSTVDNERLGAGTKLPHNVTGLFGVMNGASSDLRTGLPAQMIEIHEPIRLQLVIENRPAVLAAILERQPAVAEVVRNAWVHVISVDPGTGEMLEFVPGQGFVPWQPVSGEPPSIQSVPTTHSWPAYYQGHRSFLPPVRLVEKPPHRPATPARAAKSGRAGRSARDVQPESGR